MIGISEERHFLFFLGTLVFAILVFSLSFKAFTTYMLLRFVRMQEHALAARLISTYLQQPYTWFLRKHSADLGKSVLSEVNQVVGNAIMPIMQMFSAGAVIIAMVTLIMIVDFHLAIMVGGMLLLIYGVLYLTMTRYLSRIGKERLQLNEERFKSVTEVFGGIKEVKVGGLEKIYINRFAKPSMLFAKVDASASVVAQLPRFFLEMLAFGGLLLVVLFFLSRESSIEGVLPVICLFAFAGYRLMPAMQQFYSYSTMLRYAGPSLDSLYNDLFALKSEEEKDDGKSVIKFDQEIRFEDVTFSYPNSSKPVLDKISLNIPRNSIIGLVGPTGSGKTTLVDLILGLLKPDSGRFSIDGACLDGMNKNSWQRMIGYVPQNIFLSDDTIKANIALGCPPDEIDSNELENASRIANIHEFIVNELPEGYDNKVGERGVRLSGGQRQRIGIARALYHRPKLLIFDEATSALDNLTEQTVMEAIQRIGHETTIILIAHRLSTVRSCDQIYLFQDGQISDRGTYDQLIEGNETFRAMALHDG